MDGNVINLTVFDRNNGKELKNYIGGYDEVFKQLKFDFNIPQFF